MDADPDRLDAKIETAVVLDLEKARQARDSSMFKTTKRFLDPVKTAAVEFWILLFLAICLFAFLSTRRK